jgi:hypothetical protein
MDQSSMSAPLYLDDLHVGQRFAGAAAALRFSRPDPLFRAELRTGPACAEAITGKVSASGFIRSRGLKD